MEWMNRSKNSSLFAEVFFLKTIFVERNQTERSFCRFEAWMDQQEKSFRARALFWT